ncbi:MAG: class I SAM-dependent methyltransferase [Methanomassiliicoccales archaeon]
MTEDIRKGVAGTAFVVNHSRTKLPEVSQDIYAHLWVNQESVEMWDRFASQVYPNDDANLCSRTRFFLENLRDFISKNPDPAFVDLASGFDNYPFLVESACRFLEFDCEGTMAYKRCMVDQWMTEGKLPIRKVEYHPTDLNDPFQRGKMQRILAETIGNRPSMVTMQGVTYYLEKEALDDIFRLLAAVQQKDSLLLFDYWRPDALEYDTMMRFKKFLEEDLGCAEQKWNLFDRSYIRTIPGYEEIESTEIAELERRYSTTRRLQQREKIPGFYSVLRRT